MKRQTPVKHANSPRTKARGSLARKPVSLSDLCAVGSPLLDKVCGLLSAGCTVATSAAAIGLAPATLQKWVDLALAGSGRSARLGYLRERILESIAQASAPAEVDVRRRDPKAWLARGPRKLLDNAWSENESTAVPTGPTTTNVLVISGEQSRNALAELQAAGVLTLNAVPALSPAPTPSKS